MIHWSEDWKSIINCWCAKEALLGLGWMLLCPSCSASTMRFVQMSFLSWQSGKWSKLVSINYLAVPRRWWPQEWQVVCALPSGMSCCQSHSNELPQSSCALHLQEAPVSPSAALTGTGLSHHQSGMSFKVTVSQIYQDEGSLNEWPVCMVWHRLGA